MQILEESGVSTGEGVVKNPHTTGFSDEKQTVMEMINYRSMEELRPVYQLFGSLEANLEREG